MEAQKSAKEVASFYDAYSGQQSQVGVNLRHYTILHALIKNGLKKHHNVLEIGCGVGPLSGLIVKYLKSGRFLGVDISEKSVQLATKHLGKPGKVEFTVSDMQQFSRTEKFDFIVLPDVIEHIPAEQHSHLFKTLRQHMHDNSLIYIHVPHPLSIEYYRKNKPELLQIIDQSIHLDELSKNVYPHGLIIHEYKAYNLYHHEYDYATITIGVKQADQKFIPFAQSNIILRKTWLRIYYMLKSL